MAPAPAMAHEEQQPARAVVGRLPLRGTAPPAMPSQAPVDEMYTYADEEARCHGSQQQATGGAEVHPS